MVYKFNGPIKRYSNTRNIRSSVYLFVSFICLAVMLKFLGESWSLIIVIINSFNLHFPLCEQQSIKYCDKYILWFILLLICRLLIIRQDFEIIKFIITYIYQYQITLWILGIILFVKWFLHLVYSLKNKVYSMLGVFSRRY